MAVETVDPTKQVIWESFEMFQNKLGITKNNSNLHLRSRLVEVAVDSHMFVC